MLVRLLYASRAVDPVAQEELLKILAQSNAHNPASGITGVLCSSGRIFLQLLEGGRMQVNALYNRIAADPRHDDVVVLAYAEISERRFANWSMGLVNLERVNPSLLLKYSESATLDPYAVCGAASMALLDDLMATASIIGHASLSPVAAR
jgi:stage V sporulation protein SpoVS